MGRPPWVWDAGLGACPNQAVKVGRGETRDGAFGGDAARLLEERRQDGGVGERVHQPGSAAGGAGPPVDEAHRVGDAGPEPALVVVRQELGLVGGHVHVHRALGLAALAGQAQVERARRPARRASRRARRRGASRTAGGRGRGWSPPPRGSPCSSDTSSRSRRRGTCPTPTQRLVALAKSKPSSGNAKWVSTWRSATVGAEAQVVVGPVRARPPCRGSSRPSGSQMSLNAANAPTSSSPYILTSSSARAWPSPCSPESEPP